MTVYICPNLGDRVANEQAAHALWQRATMAVATCSIDWTPDPPTLVFADDLTTTQSALLSALATGATTAPTSGLFSAVISAALTVSGTSAPPGAVDLHAVVPSGQIDGSNAVHTLASAPAFLLLFRNGLFMQSGAQNDYTLAGNVLTFTAGNVCQPGDSLIAIVT